MVPKLYKNINLLNENNIIRAHYFGIDFINEQGELFGMKIDFVITWVVVLIKKGPKRNEYAINP